MSAYIGKVKSFWTAVIECNDTICFIVGIYRNPLTFNTNGTMILEVNKSGEILDTVLLAHETYSLTAWEKNLRFFGDHKIRFLGSILTEVPYRPWLVTYDYLNKTIDTTTFLNVAGPIDNYTIGRNWFYSDSTLHITYEYSLVNVYLRTAIDQYDNAGMFTQRAVLSYTDGNFNESLLILEDKVILGMRLYSPQPPFKPLLRCGLFSLSKDMTLNTVWVSPADSSFFRATDMLQVSEKDYIISSIHVNQQSKDIDPFIPWLLRVNTQTQEILWSINLGLNVEFPYNASNALLYNLDSSAVYVAGQQFETGTSDNPPQTHGFLAKVNMDGQLLWIRRYLGTIDSKGPDHKIFDAELLSDGSIFMVGESTDLYYEEPPGQRGWLLKVDSFGCLVPGCQEVMSVEENDATSLDVRLYPNPVSRSNHLGLYFGEDRDMGDIHMDLYDLQGICHMTKRIKHTGPTTYLLDLPSISAGIYVLKVSMEDGRFWSGRVVVAGD